jgi:hypothetical protein
MVDLTIRLQVAGAEGQDINSLLGDDSVVSLFLYHNFNCKADRLKAFRRPTTKKSLRR